MSKRLNKHGFSLLEIMIVIAIIAIISAVVLPNIGSFMPRYTREKTIARLNALVLSGWQRAIMNHSIHKIQFDFNTRTVMLLEQSEKLDTKKEPEYIPIKGTYLASHFSWPPELDVKQFFIEGFDEIERFAGNRKTAQVCFFLMPEGMAQNAIINITDTSDIKNGTAKKISLVLNPFNAQFEQYDTFQKP